MQIAIHVSSSTVLTVIESTGSNPREAGTDARCAGEARRLAAGEILFLEGEPRGALFRVESGALCIYRTRPDGSRDVLEFAFPGDLAGLGYLGNHVATAQATVETKVVSLPRAKSLDHGHDHGARGKGRLRDAIAQDVTLLREVPAPNPVQRVAALFVTLSRNNANEGRDPDILTDSLQCGVVAGYLGMSVDQLAGYLGELEARGLIEPCDSGLRLKDLGSLEALADAAE
jgi:CRP/FNR family transcriptional regulator